MKNKKILFLLIPIILIMIWLVIFIIDYNRYLKGKTPIFTLNITINDGENISYTEYNCILYKVIKYESLYGKNTIELKSIFNKSNPLTLKKEEYEYISKYITEQNNIDLKYKDEKCFTILKILDVEKGKRIYLKEVSAHIYNSCYYVSNKQIKHNSSYSIPHKIILNVKEDLAIESIEIPKDGNKYAKDIKKLFSKPVRIQIENLDYDLINEELENKVNEFFYPLKLNK